VNVPPYVEKVFSGTWSISIMSIAISVRGGDN